LKGYTWIFITVGVLLGLLLAHQFRFTNEIKRAEALERVNAMTAEIGQLQKEQEALQNLVNGLRTTLDNLTPLNPELREDFEIAKIVAGVTELSGPGVEITLNDSTIALMPGDNPSLYLLHDEDLLLILNELKAAGAEAISINDHRILATTEVRCAGPSILLDKNKRLTPPYTIHAIGDQDNLEAALNMKGGVVQSLQVFGIYATVKKAPHLVIPAYSGVVVFEYAEVVAD